MRKQLMIVALAGLMLMVLSNLGYPRPPHGSSGGSHTHRPPQTQHVHRTHPPQHPSKGTHPPPPSGKGAHPPQHSGKKPPARPAGDVLNGGDGNDVIYG